MSKTIDLEPSWLSRLKDEFDAPYFLKLKEFLKSEKKAGKTIYPPGPEIFAALDQTPFEKVKVVIIGQDPYHGPNQAHGLCFSVRKGIPPPPSLKNIFRELESEFGNEESPDRWFIPNHGDLTAWSEQGVLLLNAVMTVERGKAGSHQNKGWEIFTDAVIAALNRERNNLVFMLWGGYAKKKGRYIDRSKHLVLESGHPSPLSANKGHWFGNQHFSSANDYLVNQGQNPIRW